MTSSASAPSAPDPRAPRRVRLSRTDQIAEIRYDEITEGWCLDIDGMEQSHVDLADPRVIRHEYLARIAAVLDAMAPACSPIRVLHLGAGALTLPRWVQASRPGSEQTVVEIERELLDLVTTALPLPGGTVLRQMVGDAREMLGVLGEERFDAIVLDVFTGEDSPAHLACADAYLEMLALLSESGLLLVNIGDDAGLRFWARQVRELDDAAATCGLPGSWTLADATLVQRRSEGNLVQVLGPGLTQAQPASPDGTVSHASAEDQRAAWLAAGPHPAAVLDPAHTLELAAAILER